MSVLEAAACEIPSITSNVGGLTEVNVHYKTGFVVNPDDPVKLAESMGAIGMRMMEKSDVEKVFNKMLEVNDKPVFVECVVDPDDMVFPMVPAGGSNDQIIMNKEDLKKL